MVDFKKDSWLYALLAALLALIAIFTPWGSYDTGPFTIYSWLGGAVGYYDSPVDAWVGTGASLWTFGITIFSIALLGMFGIRGWKGTEYKWDWLVYLLTGLAMIIFPILALAFESTSGAVIGFAPIGIIIAGVLAVLAFVMDKFMGE
jgi:hypothetical protein